MNIFFAEKEFERFEDVTVDILKKAKVGLLLCDMDNTLKVRQDSRPEPELKEWVNNCKGAGIKVVVISNNGRKKKIQAFCRPLGIDCIWWAKKPLSTKLTETMKKYGYAQKDTVMLGDKWSTDVLAAFFAGVRAWKVQHRRSILTKDEKKIKKIRKKNEQKSKN